MTPIKKFRAIFNEVREVLFNYIVDGAPRGEIELEMPVCELKCIPLELLAEIKLRGLDQKKFKVKLILHNYKPPEIRIEYETPRGVEGLGYLDFLAGRVLCGLFQGVEETCNRIREEAKKKLNSKTK